MSTPHRDACISYDALGALLQGGRVVTRAVAGTLGPHGRPVVGTAPDGTGPELLTRAGTIARRIVDTGDGATNAGAMLARDVVCTVHEELGDGGATAAVIYERLLTEAARMVAAAAEPHLLADELSRAGQIACQDLSRLVLPTDPDEATTVIIEQSRCAPETAAAIRGALAASGDGGWVSVVASRGSEPSYEAIEGYRALGTVSDAAGAGSGLSRSHTLGAATVLVTGDPLVDLAGFASLVSRAARGGHQVMLVIAPSVSTAVHDAIARARGTAPRIVVAEIGGGAVDIIEDLASYCGARVIGAHAGDDLALVALDALGECRRMWFGFGEFGVVAPPRASVESRLAQLTRAALIEDLEARDRISARMAGLRGRSVVLRIPVAHQAEEADTLQSTSSLIRTARRARDGGVVAGGGAALARLSTGPSTMGAELLRIALAEPLRRIAQRGGWVADAILEETRSRPIIDRFDVVAGEWIECSSGSVVDSRASLEAAITIVISAICTAITSVLTVRLARRTERPA